MNVLYHMSFVVVIDYVLFRYWYMIANRFTVLNFHETAYLPARYIITGLLAGALVYWLYLIPVLLLSRFHRGYRHPDPGNLWLITAIISSIQIVKIVRGESTPPLTFNVTAMLIIHLQMVHLIMFYAGKQLKKYPQRILIPGVMPGILAMLAWEFWLWYSFAVRIEGEPSPLIGTELERSILIGILWALIAIGLAFSAGGSLPFLKRDTVIIPDLNVTFGDLMTGFYSAWALFYLIVPVGHYLVRGYVTSHSNLFPAFLLGLLVPLIWSLVLMWGVIWLLHPLLIIRLPRPTLFER